MDKTKLVESVYAPFLQAVITGVMVGVVVGVLAALVHLPQPALIGCALAGVVMLASWLTFRQDWKRRADTVAGVLDELQLKRMEAETIRLEVISDEGRAADYLMLPGGPERLALLAEGLTSGKPFTCRGWAHLYSPAEFAQLRDELISRGFARWRSQYDNRSGVVLSPAGRAVFRRLVRPPTHQKPATWSDAEFPSFQTVTHKHTAGGYR